MKRSPQVIADGPFSEPVADHAHNLLALTRLSRLSPTDYLLLSDNVLLLAMARSTDRKLAVRLHREELLLALGKYLRKHGQTVRPPRRVTSPLAENMALIASVLGFDATQVAVLEFLVAIQQHKALRELPSLSTRGPGGAGVRGGSVEKRVSRLNRVAASPDPPIAALPPPSL